MPGHIGRLPSVLTNRSEKEFAGAQLSTLPPVASALDILPLVRDEVRLPSCSRHGRSDL